MDRDQPERDTIRKAKLLTTEASEALRALERAQQVVDELVDTRGALEEIAAIAHGIERSLRRARFEAEGIVDDLREATDSAEDLARRR